MERLLSLQFVATQKVEFSCCNGATGFSLNPCRFLHKPSTKVSLGPI